MGILIRLLLVAGGVCAVAGVAEAGKNGFADKPGGGKNDPIIKVSASIGPTGGALFSLSEDDANSLYQFNSGSGAFQLTSTPPVIPPDAQGANQFLHIEFPFKISSGKVAKTIMKAKADFAPILRVFLPSSSLPPPPGLAFTRSITARSDLPARS